METKSSANYGRGMEKQGIKQPGTGLGTPMNGKKPSKAEQKWIDFIIDYGCIVCKNELDVYSPASVHHIDGSRKEGAHFNTLPLCWQHHQSGRCDPECVSRHPYKTGFEKRYGTEKKLLAQLKKKFQPEAASGASEL